MDRLIMTFVVGVLALGASPGSQAHAFLDHASPPVGSSVPAAPPVVTLWFTQDLEPAFSSVTVTNEAGQRVDLGKAQIPPGSPAELQIGLKPLAGGPIWSAGTSSRSILTRPKALSPSRSSRELRHRGRG